MRALIGVVALAVTKAGRDMFAKLGFSTHTYRASGQSITLCHARAGSLTLQRIKGVTFSHLVTNRCLTSGRLTLMLQALLRMQCDVPCASTYRVVVEGVERRREQR